MGRGLVLMLLFLGAVGCAPTAEVSTGTAGPSSPQTPRATIDPRPVIEPFSVTLSPGQEQRFSAYLQEAGQRIPGQSKFVWSVSPVSLGTVTTDGVFSASQAGGTGQVIAHNGPFEGSATVVVVRPGAQSRVDRARACLPDGSMSLVFTADLAYISYPTPVPWWETTAHETQNVRLADGGATQYRSTDPTAPRISTAFIIRAERWRVDGRLGDPRYAQAVECAYARLSER